MKTIFGETEVETYHLTDEDWKNIEKLSNDKYRTWEWNYGRNPKYNFEREEKFEKDLYKSNLMLSVVKSNMQKFSEISLVLEM